MEIYTHVGLLCTCFAGLEITILQLTAKLINRNNPSLAEPTLSKLSFRQTVSAFRNNTVKVFHDSQMLKQWLSFANRIDDVATRRNDIVHSAWTAYGETDYGQHRPRSKGERSLGTQAHANDPIDQISKLMDEICMLLMESSDLDDHLMEIGEQTDETDQ